MKINTAVKKAFNSLLKPFGCEVVRSKDLIDFYLHEYSNYEEYKEIQTFHNKRKLANVWADEKTLSVICGELTKQYNQKKLRGICHGSRNGFEQKYFKDNAGFDVIGTDISNTATQFEGTVQWDFHDENQEWIGSFDFVYSNSLDQGWNPKVALKTWLNQLNDNGVLIIEHTEAHGPRWASEMDPFGVRPTVMPYVLCEWFGYSISVKVVKSKKANNGRDVWLFFIRKHERFLT